MPNATESPRFASGEFRRSLDQRFRVSLPLELLDDLGIQPPATCLLSKERVGALSIWPLEPWHSKFSEGLRLIQQKHAAGRFAERIPNLQTLGRLMSTRQRQVQIAGRGRMVIPEGFREFLGAAPDSELMVVGAAVCIELWQPAAWAEQLAVEIPRFQQLYDELSQ